MIAQLNLKLNLYDFKRRTENFLKSLRLFINLFLNYRKNSLSDKLIVISIVNNNSMEKKAKAKKLKNDGNKKEKVQVIGEKSTMLKETTSDSAEYLIEIPDGGYGWIVLIASFVKKKLNFF